MNKFKLKQKRSIVLMLAIASLVGAYPAYGQGFTHEKTTPSAGSGAVSVAAPVSEPRTSDSTMGLISNEVPMPGAPALLSTIEGVDFDIDAANSGFYHIPPDPHGAAGPTHLVSVVNTSIFFSTKDGVTTSSQSLASFFASLSPVTGTFDPKVIYDQYEGRFVVVTLERVAVSEAANAGNISRILVAVSATSDPTGTWRFHAIDSKITTGGFEHWADYPGFAIDGQAVYITNNLFRFVTNVFGGYRLWIIDKGVSGGFYAGSAASVTIHDPAAVVIAGGGSGFGITTMPTHLFGTAQAGVGTFLVQYSGLTAAPTDFVGVIRVDNPLGSIAFSEQIVSGGDFDSQAVFGEAPQSGTATTVDTNDRRLLHAVWRNNNLYAVTTLTPPSGADAGHETAHWFRMDTSTLSTITIADQGNIGGEDIDTGARTFFPSVAVNSAGDMSVGFALSGPNIFPGAYYTSRLAGDPAGTVDSTGTLATGVAFYVRTFPPATRNRWGDYSGISVDPSDDTGFWVFNVYAKSQGTDLGDGELGRWATRFGYFTTDVAPTADTITPSTTGPTNASSVDFTVTFSEDVSNFATAADVVVAHTGTASTGVTITGGPATYTASVTGITGNGSFTLAVNTGSDVQDLLGNGLASSVTSAAVTIDNTAPGVTVDSLTTDDDTPTLSGTIDDAMATISVTVDDQTNPASNNGSTWELTDNTLSPVPPGTYDVEVVAQDLAGNIGTDDTFDELTIPPPLPSAGRWSLGLLTLMLLVAGYAIVSDQSVIRDYGEAVKFYRLAAEQGHAEAQSNLGKMYVETENYSEAAKWYRKAADQGIPEAQCVLGIMYYSGIGVPKDHFKADELLRQADEQGVAEAKPYLERLRRLSDL